MMKKLLPGAGGQLLASLKKKVMTSLSSWSSSSPPKNVEPLTELQREAQLVRKLPSKWFSGHTMLDRAKDRAIEQEFRDFRRRSCFGNGFFDETDRFFLERIHTPVRYIQDIDVPKAKAAWKADIEAGIRRPNHYYVSEEFYSEEKKKKDARVKEWFSAL